MQAGRNNRYTHRQREMLVLLHKRVDHSHSPRVLDLDWQRPERTLDTTKTLLAFAALGSTAAAGWLRYASKRESITQDEGCMPMPRRCRPPIGAAAAARGRRRKRHGQKRPA